MSGDPLMDALYRTAWGDELSEELKDEVHDLVVRDAVNALADTVGIEATRQLFLERQYEVFVKLNTETKQLEYGVDFGDDERVAIGVSPREPRYPRVPLDDLNREDDSPSWYELLDSLTDDCPNLDPSAGQRVRSSNDEGYQWP